MKIKSNIVLTQGRMCDKLIKVNKGDDREQVEVFDSFRELSGGARQ